MTQGGARTWYFPDGYLCCVGFAETEWKGYGP